MTAANRDSLFAAATDRRVFLGWDGPALHRAVDWLTAAYLDHGVLNLSSVTIVTPGSRAGRRLGEILVERTVDAVLRPPDTITIGQLPEQLYDAHATQADTLSTALARLHAMRSFDADALRTLVRHPPEPDDVVGWLSLADDLGTLRERLAAEGLTAADVPERCAGMEDFPDDARWQTLAALEAAYESQLDRAGLIDVHAARAAAIAARACRSDRDIVLLAVGEISAVARAMLEQLTSPVHVLVHAPESEADLFDEWGAVRPDAWAQRRINLPDDMVVVVDRPADQARAAVALIGEANGALVPRNAPEQSLAADEVTIGLGDPALSPMIERALDLAGLPARSAVLKTVAESRPAVLLQQVARFVGGQRFDDFAALVRHPDVEAFIVRTLDAAEGEEPSTRDSALTLLDRYATEHLQPKITQRWLGEDDERLPLEQLHAAVTTLIPQGATQLRPIGAWSRAIADLLGHVYGHAPLSRYHPIEGELVDALSHIGTALREQAERADDDALGLPVTFGDAIRLTLHRVSSMPIPPQGGQPAVELLGYLELQLDDAPALVVTGLSEGAVPQSVNSDAFLPDRVAAHLGLADNRKRYARDAMVLEALRHSRPFVRLVAGRRGAQNDPLTPSRLLLACDDDHLPQRIERFYEGDAPAAPVLLTAGGVSRFAFPVPEPPGKPRHELAVTDFRAYIACPYRFYLKRIQRLESLSDRAPEWSPPDVGIVMHRVLERLADPAIASEANPRRVSDFLSAALEDEVTARHGARPRAAIAVQRELLRQRLDTFAHWQAQAVRDGWSMLTDLAERDMRAQLIVDDTPFGIRGRIDRIDQHDELGHRIIDYKTFDTARDPVKDHGQGADNDFGWTNLQLPLYVNIARALGVEGPLELGYINLPKNRADIGFTPAPWDDDDLASARGAADEVIRRVRRGVFWPPADPPPYDDGLAGICMDGHLERSSIIAAGGDRAGGDA